MTRQHPLLFSAITSMVLFTVVTMTADVRHALGSHQVLSWTVTALVYAVIVARRLCPIGAVAVATAGTIVLMGHSGRCGAWGVTISPGVLPGAGTRTT